MTRDGRQTTSTLRERLQEHWESLSEGEIRVAQYLLSRYPSFAFETVTQVADGADTSARTVIRFFQKLGYSTFAELQGEAREAIESGWSSPIARLGELDHVEPEASIAGSIVEKSLALISAISQATIHAVETAAKLIIEAEGRVFVGGAGKASSVASYLWTQLTLTRESCVLLGDMGHATANLLLDSSASDVLVILNFRRYPLIVDSVLEGVKREGTTIVMITDDVVSQASINSDCVIGIEVESDFVFDSYVGAMVIAQIMSELVILGLPRKVGRQRLDNYERWIEQLDLFHMKKDVR